MEPEQPNREGTKIHLLQIAWDPELQDVAGLKFEPREFKSWPFIISVLGIAQEAAKLQLREQQIAAMQQRQQQQIQEAILAAKQAEQVNNRLIQG